MTHLPDAPLVPIPQTGTRTLGSRAPRLLPWLLLLGWCCSSSVSSKAAETKVVIHAQPLHSGRISPMLFGNFVELLDDVVPGMWAEMLNDRSFEGVTRAANWSYYDGTPTLCDRQWDANPTWSSDTNQPFNGTRSARLISSAHYPASLTQSGLAVKRGLQYQFSGWFRADQPKLRATVRLKALLPTGQWLTLASAKLPRPSASWTKFSVSLTSKGETDRAAFELYVEGACSLWADKLSLMPADNCRGWRPDVVQAIKDVHPAILRWGGSTCDPGGYRWKNGIGDRDHRTPFPNKVWGRIDSNDVGIDEFCQLCELTGVQPLICLSFADGPESAGDLVAYCNGSTNTVWGTRRAANGHPQPYHVRYWQVGNEISGDDERYLSQFDQFLRAIRTADSTARILSSFPTAKLLRQEGRYLAYVAPHHYTSDLAACDRDLTSLTQLLDQTLGCERVRVAVTEWNVTGGDWGLERGRMLTLGSALLNARYLHVLMRHSDKVELACRSNLANSYAGAIIETSPAGLLKRPSYYVMQLYARHAKPVPLRLEPSSDAVDLFACGTTIRSFCLFAINPGTAPADLACTMQGFPGAAHAISAEALCDTLDARQPDVMNHWEAPGRVRIVPREPPGDRMTLPPLSVTAVEYQAQ